MLGTAISIGLSAAAKAASDYAKSKNNSSSSNTSSSSKSSGGSSNSSGSAKLPSPISPPSGYSSPSTSNKPSTGYSGPKTYNEWKDSGGTLGKGSSDSYGGYTPGYGNQPQIPDWWLQQQQMQAQIEAQIQAQIQAQQQAINQALERQLQAAQLNVKQNNSFLNEQLQKLGSEKAMADEKTINLQNRRGGFYSGGLDYQLGQNTQGYNQQQEALRRDVEQRNSEIYDRNRLLAEQASDQISKLQQQAPTLVQQRIREELDRQRSFAMQEAGLTGYYNGAPTLQMQGIMAEQEQAKVSAQQKAQADAVQRLWDASDLVGYVLPELAQMLGVPEGTPTMEARKLLLNAQQWEMGFNADQAYRNAQIGIDQQRLNNDMYKFNTNLNNDNYWQGLKYDTTSAQTANKETEKAIKPWIDRIVKSGAYVTKDKSGYLQFNSTQSKEALKDSIFTLNIPENEKKALLQHFGIGPSNFSVSTKGDGRYNNLYKTQQSNKSKTFNQFQSDLGQAIQQTGVPASWAPYLTELFGRESSWNPNAKNPKSTAHGYAQFLNSTRSNYEKKYGIKYDSPVNQLILGIYYVRDRYSDPVKALSFWDKNKWY